MIVVKKKQLVNCCAAYQAMLQQRQENGTSSIADEEDQLDIDMVRLSAAVQAVDGMLDEIDRLLKVGIIYLFINNYYFCLTTGLFLTIC